MKLKNVLTNYFEHADLSLGEKTDFEKLEENILSNIEPKQKRNFFSVTVVSLFSFLLILVGGLLYLNSHIQPVSAQEVINKTTEAFKSVDRIHYKIYYGGKGYEKPITPEVATEEGWQGTRPQNKTYEFWYDFQNKISRIEGPQYSRDGITVRIEKNIYENNIEGSDVLLLYTYTAGGRNKEGLFQDHQSSRAFPSQEIDVFNFNTPEDPHQRFEKLLTRFKDGHKETTLDTIQENGKDYYKLMLQQEYYEKIPVMQLTSYTLLVEKDTYKPYREIRSYDNGNGTIELTYLEVDSDFDDSVFGPLPPKGYTIAQNPKIKFLDSFANAGPILIKACGISPINPPGSNDLCAKGVQVVYHPDVSLFTEKGIVLPQAGTSLVGLDFKLYKSKQTFTTKEEAKNAKDVEYSELKSAKGALHFPEIEKPVPGTFRKFRLEMYNSKTEEKMDEIETIQEIIVTEVYG